MPRHDHERSIEDPGPDHGTFLDEITHDIPTQNWGPADWARDFDAMKAIGIDHTLSHFPDPAHGEWYGYLDRRGEVTHRFKGGPYKGCQWLCWRLARKLENEA